MYTLCAIRPALSDVLAATTLTENGVLYATLAALPLMKWATTLSAQEKPLQTANLPLLPPWHKPFTHQNPAPSVNSGGVFSCAPVLPNCLYRRWLDYVTFLPYPMVHGRTFRLTGRRYLFTGLHRSFESPTHRRPLASWIHESFLIQSFLYPRIIFASWICESFLF